MNYFLVVPIVIVWTWLTWTVGYVQGKRRGLVLGEKIGFGKRRHLQMVGEIH